MPYCATCKMLRSAPFAANIPALFFVGAVLLAPTTVLAADGENVVRSTETQLQALYRNASPAIVRFSKDEAGDRKLSMTGVIVSADGYIACCARGEITIFSNHNPIFCFLPDGRRAKCEPLGWSEQWNIGLLKITEPGQWPHVEIGSSANLAAGQVCAALDYGWLQTGKEPQERAPQLRIGSIHAVRRRFGSPPRAEPKVGRPFSRWTDRLSASRPKSIFDTTSTRRGAELFKKYWAPLTAGKNLDLELLAGDRKNTDPAASHSKQQPIDPESDEVKSAIEKAAAATVRIRRSVEMTNSWSGIIVSADGYIATCADHFGMPGETVSIELPDGAKCLEKSWESIASPMLVW